MSTSLIFLCGLGTSNRSLVPKELFSVFQILAICQLAGLKRNSCVLRVELCCKENRQALRVNSSHKSWALEQSWYYSPKND